MLQNLLFLKERNNYELIYDKFMEYNVQEFNIDSISRPFDL